MTREILDEEAVGLGRDDELASGLLDGKRRGELLNVAARSGRRGLNLGLRRGEDLRRLVLDTGANAALFFNSVGLGVGAHLGDLIVEPGEACLNRVQASIGF